MPNRLLILLLGLLTMLGSQPAAAQIPAFDRATALATSAYRGQVTAVDVAVDAAGNSYVAGHFYGRVGFGSFTLNSTNAGQLTDVFVAKLDAQGNYLWVAQAGGQASDEAVAVAVDGSGNVYLTGLFLISADFGGITLSSGTSQPRSFVAKLDAARNWLWAQRAGGGSEDEAHDVTTDASGNVYLTGRSGGGSFGSTPLAPGGLLVAKLNPSGAVQWVQSSTKYDTAGRRIRVDGAGNVYVLGDMNGTVSFGSTTLTNVGLFVTKLNAAGSYQWVSTNAGVASSSAVTNGRGLAVDAAGYVYVTGYRPRNIHFGTLSPAANDGAFVARLTPAGSWEWALQSSPGSFGSEDYGTGLALGPDGELLVSGMYSSNSIQLGSVVLSSPTTGREIFLARLEPATGAVRWAIGGGGSGTKWPTDLAIDAAGYAHVAGYCYGTNVSFGPVALAGFSAQSIGFTARVRTDLVTATAGAGRVAGGLEVFPNPARGRFTLALPGLPAGQPVPVVLFDALGRAVYQHTFPGGARPEVAVPQLAPGLYRLRVLTPAGYLSRAVQLD